MADTGLTGTLLSRSVEPLSTRSLALATVLSTRGVGVESALSALPAVVVVLAALLTQLGDLWFLTLLVGSVYWLGPHTPRVGRAVDRDRTIRLIGLLVLTYTVVAVAKPLFALPRPPGAAVAPHADQLPTVLHGVYEWLSTGDGYGFPSGHAFGGTLLYGGLAWTVRVGSRRRRAAFAGGMIVLLSATRLVLGVHYLVDVLAGTGLGLLALAVALSVPKPRHLFGLAAAIGVGGALAVDPSVKVLAAAGAAVGALGAWLAVGETVPANPSRVTVRATVIVAAVILTPLGVAGVLLHTIRPVAGLLAVVGGGLLVAMPLIGERVGEKSGVS